MTRLLDTEILETAPNPTVAVIWMHGLGADGHDFMPIVRQLDLRGLPGIRFVFPHAETMPITFFNGQVLPAWFDVYDLKSRTREDETGLRASQLLIEALIEREKARGIPASRIILAGFSQGCAITLQTGLRHPEKLAGMMCLSGWAPLAAKLPAERAQENLSTPIFMVHGRVDDVVPFQFAEQSRTALVAMGYEVEWHEYMMRHEVCMEELTDISAWLKKVLL